MALWFSLILAAMLLALAASMFRSGLSTDQAPAALSDPPMAANVRVNQSAIEMVTVGVPNVRVCQSCIEFVTTPEPPSITCGNPPPGAIGTPYSHAFPATGGLAPYTFSIIAGALPVGTNLNTSTGVVSGLPQASGNFTFTIRVTDSLLQSDTVQCSIVITAPAPQPIPGGGPPAILCPAPINLYDLCAEDEVRRTRRIHFKPSCSIPCNQLPWDEDANPVPAGGRPFHITGTIVTPATAAGDVLVCQDRVPCGYDAFLTSIYQIYQGSGFQQGSGDIVWRIRRNLLWLKQLGNNPYALGSFRNPMPLTEGQIIVSGSLFSYFVNVPNLSGMIQIGASRISCGMLGFYWPRG
jgi:Putative Ig domain